MASIESSLLPAETWDFSENHLKNTHGFDWSPCSGGNVDMATAYLARWSGAVSEADDPYSPTDVNNSPAAVTVRKHIQDVFYLPRRSGPTDNDLLKQTVMQYGAVYISMYYNDAYYSSANRAYYYTGSGSNHGVAVVGWDDNFDRNKFKTPPEGNGAFIIKNSWGTGWGDNGYFYISYYDTSAGRTGKIAAFAGVEPTTTRSRVYQYDPLGWTMSLGYSSDTAWFSNVFTAQASESINAVSFYASSPQSLYTVYVYTGVTSTPTSGTLAGTTTGTIPLAGYHTIALSSPVSVVAGAAFSVVVKLQTPGYNYPVACEQPVSGYASAADAAAGQSYISSSGTSWLDLASTSWPKANVCLKAFVAAGAAQPASILSPIPGTVLPGSSVTFTWNAGSSISEYQLYVGTTGVGSNNLLSGTPGTNQSQLVTGLPLNGETIYVRLWSRGGSTWLWNDYTYTVPRKAAMATPAAGSTLTASAVTFTWDAGVGVSQYHLYVGTTGAGSANVFSLNTGTGLSQVVSNIPLGGGTIYVRLWSSISSTWQYNDYTYTASTGTLSPANITSPTPGSTLTASSVTFSWDAGSGMQYHLYVGTTGTGSYNIFSLNTGTARSQTVNSMPSSGTVYIRLWTLVAGGAWLYRDYTYAAGGSGIGAITSPAPGSVLTGSSATFAWSSGTGTQYHLDVGTAGAGSNNVFSLNTGTARTQTVTNLPTNGATLYVRLWTLLGSTWLYADYTYTAMGSDKGDIISPTPGSLLPGASVTFTWTAGIGAQYHLYVGTTGVGSSNLFSLNTGTLRSQVVSGLPMTGGTVYVRLWTLIGSLWLYNDYTYTAAGNAKANITSPTPGSLLPGSSAVFTWDAGLGTQYHLYVGTTGVGSSNVFSLNTGSARSQTVSNLPMTGGAVYVRLWTLVGIMWQYNDYTYTAAH